ncbi:MAG TPA: plasmid partitioning protein RepB [Methylocella sp.]|nr:plasmid partitioning protein RepB [Methylocella sp.]
MARKHLLDHLLSPSDAPVSTRPPQRKLLSRGVGVIGAVSESIETMEADLRDAKEKIETGEIVVEIATDLIDPSFITDRLGDDAELEEFIASIREHGQRTPILVRPHPESPGRYQIAFGHRRFHALRSLGRPVKALVKPLTDEELVVAQGQENQSRLDLSFIERAIFAARLEARDFRRDVICSALNIDKTEASRMIFVVTSLPGELIDSIGPARSTGRRKWMELAKALEPLDWSESGARLLGLCREGGRGSDEKFDAVLRAAVADRWHPTAAERAPAQHTFNVDKKPGVIRIRFDETNLPPDVVEDCLSRVREVCNSFGVKS